MEPRTILIACAPGISDSEAASLEVAVAKCLEDQDESLVVNYALAFQRIAVDDLPHKVFTIPGASKEIANKFFDDLKTKDVVVVQASIGISDLREA